MHIAHSDIVEQIFKNNKTRVETILDNAEEILKPIIDEAEQAEKWDICVQCVVYVRAWNDIITSYYDTRKIHSTSSDHDFLAFDADLERHRIAYFINNDRRHGID